MLQPASTSAAPDAAWFRPWARRHAPALGLTLLIEGLLLFLLLTFGTGGRPEPVEETAPLTVTNLEPPDVADTAPDTPGDPAPAAPAQQRPAPQPPTAEQLSPRPLPPAPAQPAQTTPLPPPPLILPTPFTLPAPSTAPRAAPRPAPSTARAYGPPDVGGSPALRDTAIVGTAPNGEPLYAAAWHREPRPDELRDYLSTANSAGWGLIACRTAPAYRVVDCVALDEYPAGSQINRAILAAAWEFQVRPPRRGGQLLVGSWVRIRIDYRRAGR